MKSTIFILAILFTGWQVGHAKELEPEEEECITELNLDRDEMNRLDKQKPGPEVSSDFNNYVLCFCKKTGLMDSNGVFHYDKYMDVMVEIIKRHRTANLNPRSMAMFKQLVTPAIEKCEENPPTGSTHAETALLAVNCVADNLKNTLG